jgi:hypothetical protein
LLVAHAFATFGMTGLIWLVQGVQYPLFKEVGADAFQTYHEGHTRRITWIVLPLMTVEASTAVALWVLRPPGLSPMLLGAGAALVGWVWAATLWGAVGRHEVLSRGFDPTAHRSLLRINWTRTAAWTLRSGLCAHFLASSLAAPVETVPPMPVETLPGPGDHGTLGTP